MSTFKPLSHLRGGGPLRSTPRRTGVGKLSLVRDGAADRGRNRRGLPLCRIHEISARGSVALAMYVAGHALSGRLWHSRVGGRDSLVQAHALTPAVHECGKMS
jgi:hypothetical protein